MSELQSFDKFSTAPLRTLLNPGGKTQYDIYKKLLKQDLTIRGIMMLFMVKYLILIGNLILMEVMIVK